ncbi:MAG: pilus assembly PilX N-terminal domain-containing protein [Gammaproteobacteria bacterium]|nr:pilus assembly PilX N-terminal domain-containing protein [Gammaproteobacteria bacterium]
MINLYRKKPYGAATFLITTILLMSAILITIFGTQYGMLQQKVSSNANGSLQAFEAAEAGLDFGINYLQQNNATILASPSGGHIQPYTSSNTTNVTLANGSKFSIVYTNPTANDYTLLLVAATGTNKDGTATRTVKELVKFGSVLFTPPASPLVGKGNVTISGSSEIDNTQGTTTIVSGGSVALSGSIQTQAQGGVSSTAGHINSDIQQNVASLTNISISDFFASYFGASMTTVKNSAKYLFSGLSNYSSSVNGKAGAIIWIDQPTGTASISGSATVGTPTQPVLLIINGNFSVSGSVQIYGLIVVLGTTTTTITGSTDIVGGLIASDALSFSGSSSITYSASTLSSVQQTTTNYYARVPGSWRDF